ncbi:VanZ family protein [Neiella marina]|uniref:VanZ family protein n=1 Tax=Neiella holothuriorum TaxID=2870530 RepID=A0ABS7EJF6_9GAMM|nr:VanZ family protein [Neiella holothuriorum]MBW8191797.1 VanZ family protein [Neiella holothuriorum]
MSYLLMQQRWFQVLFISALSIVTWTCLMPLDQPPLDIDHGDKLLHFLSYLTLGLLLERAAPRWFWPVGVFALIAYSGVIELAQEQTGYRTGSWGDMLANSSGVVASLLLRPLVIRLSLNTRTA